MSASEGEKGNNVLAHLCLHARFSVTLAKRLMNHLTDFNETIRKFSSDDHSQHLNFWSPNHSRMLPKQSDSSQHKSGYESVTFTEFELKFGVGLVDSQSQCIL